MTEDEAKLKWCPMARKPGDKTPPLNPAFTDCIASACMAWRWKTEPMAYPDNGKQVATDRGYCGAFGPDPVSS